jgi:hypothetical protein
MARPVWRTSDQGPAAVTPGTLDFSRLPTAAFLLVRMFFLSPAYAPGREAITPRKKFGFAISYRLA